MRFRVKAVSVSAVAAFALLFAAPVAAHAGTAIGKACVTNGPVRACVWLDTRPEFPGMSGTQSLTHSVGQITSSTSNVVLDVVEVDTWKHADVGDVSQKVTWGQQSWSGNTSVTGTNADITCDGPHHWLSAQVEFAYFQPKPTNAWTYFWVRGPWTYPGGCIM